MVVWYDVPPATGTDRTADVNLGADPGVDVVMKPERCRELLKSTGLARAKMYLKAHLDWLDGCPYAQSPGQIHWWTRPQAGSPEGTRIVVDRERLKRSQAGLTKLVHQFPRALPKLVGNVETWSTSVSALLDRLKQAIHGNRGLVSDNDSPVEILSRTERMVVDQLSHTPTLKPLIRFVVWAGWYAPAPRQFLLPWLTRQSHWISDHLQRRPGNEGLASVIVTGDLARSDGDEFQRLLELTLAQTGCFEVVTTGLFDEVRRFTGHLRDWRNSKATPPATRQITATPYGGRAVAFVNWLAAQEQPVRQRATRLANLVLSVPLVEQWGAGWRRYHLLARQGIRELCGLARHLQGVAFHSEACRVSHEIENQFVDEPLCYPLTEVLGTVMAVATTQTPQLNQHLSAVLAEIPVEHADGRFQSEGLALRLALLREANNSRSKASEVRYYELFRKYLVSNRTPERLRPWQGLAQSWRGQAYTWYSPRSSILDELPRQSHWPDYFALLGRVARDLNYNFRMNDEVAWLMKGSNSVEQAEARFRVLATDGLLNDSVQSQINAAIELESDQLSLRKALTLIGPESHIDSNQLGALLKLHRLFVEAGWAQLVPTLLQMGKGPELQRAATQFEIACCSEGLAVLRRPTSTAIPDWAVTLPNELKAPIATMLAVFPNSRPRIRRILDKHYPDPDVLRAEIAALKQLIGSDATNVAEPGRVPEAIKRKRRLQNLTRRLEAPILVSDATVSRLSSELDQALQLDLFQQTKTQIESRVMALLAGSSGVRTFAYHRLPPSHVELVRGVLELSEPYRTYALRLLRHEWGGVEWDLLQEPANLRFLQGLAARGIRAQPWLSSRTRRVPTGEDQPEFTLAFESRPVEKLLMGYHFGTCLSPDGCNFFSAVVNAIDINKRILYGRDAKGDVIGRCLFAIGDADTIVAFRPYCHDNQFNFERHVQQFANELANEMGTVVSHTDHVSPVVAPGWYDDGACDLGNSIASDDSAVRQALRNATEETLLADLNAALSPRQLTSSMLELVVELPEFQSQPHLIRSLLRLIQEWESQLAATTLIVAARLADRIGLTTLAGKWLTRYGFDWLCRNLQGYRYDDALQVVRVMIKYRASLALRTLRATRRHGVHCDRDEYDDARRQLLAECFDALARPRLAAEMRGPLNPNGRTAVDN